jgi:hypothetical protein
MDVTVKWLVRATILMTLILRPALEVRSDAGSRPFWTEQAVFHFGNDVFFTGRASCAPSIEEGRQRAYTAALQEIKNFSHVEEITGFLIDTQMVYEESHPADCPAGSVTAWRLLRAPRAALESLARRSGIGIPEDISPVVAQNRAIRNMTPRIGMLREDIWQRYGQPRSVWMNPENGEALWEYPQFGLTLVFDHEDMLKRWKLANGKRQLSPDDVGTSAFDKRKDPAQHLPAIDLTDRLRELEARQDSNLRQQAKLYCAIRFPDNQDTFAQQRMHCEQREYERFKFPQRQN